MPDRIKKETDDVIILDKGKFNVLFSLFLGIITLSFIWLASFFNSRPNPQIEAFTFLVTAGIAGCIMKLLYDLQQDIIISKKSQSVAIRFLKSITIKEIPFSDMEEIKIKRHSYNDPETSDSWSVNIIDNQLGPTKIYDASNESDAERVAEKISEITNIKITHI